MRDAEALATLLEMLGRAGFDRADPSLDVAFATIAKWVAVPVEGMSPHDDSDKIAFEATVRAESTAYAPAGAALDFTRQFLHTDEGGEYAGMTQIVISFEYEPSPDLVDIARRAGDTTTAQFWGEPGPGSGRWAERVCADPAFAVARILRPRSVQFAQD
jgi:hypothetical protein